MAGERKASIKISFSQIRNNDSLQIWFENHFETFVADDSPPITGNAFPISTGNDIRFNLDGLHAAVRQRLINTGFDSKYSVVQALDLNGNGDPTMGHLIITALFYGDVFNFTGSTFNNQNGSNFQFTYMLDNINPILVTSATSFITCGGSSAGSITLTVTQAVGAVTYQWSNGTTTSVPTLNGIPAGNYSVTVVDSQGTSTVVNNIIVQENARIEISGTIKTRAIDITVTGGVGPFTFKWADGPTTQNRTGLASGTYAVTVTDSNGCQRAASFRVVNERFHFSQNPIPLELAATDLNTKPNLSFICEVWIEEEYLSNIFTKIYSAEQPADAAGKTTFYVETILDSRLKAYFPDFGNDRITRADGAFKRFQLKYREKFGVVPAPAAIETVEVQYVVLGGLDFEEQPGSAYFGSYLTYQKPFFTWQPTVKKVVPEQPEYLFFMPLELATTEFSVKAKLFFPQGTSETFTVLATASVKQFELWCIPVGFNLLQLQTLAGEREVLKYQVWVTDATSGNVISEVRTYQLDKTYFRHKRFFLYSNSVGGIDTLLATAAAELSLPIETETVTRNLVGSYDPGEGDTAIVSRGARPFLSLSTGYQLSRAERIALQDLRYSEDVKLAGSDRYHGGQMIFKDAGIDNEFDSVKSVDFEFHMAYRRHYTAPLKRTGYALPVEVAPIPPENN